MSDYDYSGLDAAIDEMAKGAIDLDMLAHHHYPFRAKGKYGVNHGWQSTDGQWEITADGTLKLRMQNENIPFMVGDTVHDTHRWIGFDPHDVMHKWHPLIVKAFEPWRTLPDPDGFGDDVATWRHAVSTLTTTVPIARGKGVGAINPHLDKDIHFLAGFGLTGHTIDSFKLNVGIPLKDYVVPFQRNVAAVAQGCLEAEAKLWKGSRHDLAQIANSSVTAFAQVTDYQAGSLSDDLTLLGSVASVMSLIPVLGEVAGPASTVIGLIQQFVGDASAPPKPEKYHVEGTSADEVYASVGHALHQLDQAIRSEETRIQKLSTSVTDTVSAHPDSFDVGRAAQRIADDQDRNSILPRDDGSGTLTLDYQTLDDVADRCHGVSAEFDDARRGTGGTTSSTPWIRDGAVGLGSNGPFPQWAAMVLALDHSIQHSSHYLDEAAGTMKVFVKEAKKTDAQADAALRTHVKHLHDADAPQRTPVRSGRGD